jgi:putative Holliday junction resolvase
MARYLAIDPGDKRIGLAVGDDETRIVSPVGAIDSSNSDERIRQIGKAIESHSPGALVVGLPLNMDGTEGSSARKARALATELSQEFRLPVHLVDERLTTHVADDQLSATDLSRKAKRARRDALAAATILRDFLESR